MTATATRPRPLARLGAWWRWRRDRPYRGHARYCMVTAELGDELWLGDMAEWEARRP